SGVYVGKRAADAVLREDILAISPLLRLSSIRMRTQRSSVSASAGLGSERIAVHREGLGCTLLGPDAAEPSAPAPGAIGERVAAPTGFADAGSAAATASSDRDRSDGRIDGSATDRNPAGFDRAALERALDADFESSGGTTRAIVVVHAGSIVAERYAAGFGPDTPLHGWSMAKSVLSLLVHKRLAERRMPLSTPVVDAMRRDPAPAWVGAWRSDGRAAITIGHLLTMRDGLAHDEGYAAWGPVPHMLLYEPDTAAWAAAAPLAAPPGERFRYSSAVSNILSRVLRDLFDDDAQYWAYPRESLFSPIGADSAVLEADASGTFIASSYLWASARDWARIGQLMLQDGRWGERQVVPRGWLAQATRSTAAPYGAHVWLAAEHPIGCSGRLAAGAFLMRGFAGQLAAIVPAAELVVVRLGWTLQPTSWDGCELIGRVAGALA
ncbi:MAG TPA: serine hydrolase, partial [Burkholderiaceae bacterium]|nr:serine hydrolase [Burkholderiaceae bacterium]